MKLAYFKIDGVVSGVIFKAPVPVVMSTSLSAMMVSRVDSGIFAFFPTKSLYLLSLG